MTLYTNKYRIESARCSTWDYTSNGTYFVTICTKNRQCFFGDGVDGEMNLSEIGAIVAEEWQKTAQIRPNVQLGAWVVMPNHFQGPNLAQTVVLERLEACCEPFDSPLDSPQAVAV